MHSPPDPLKCSTSTTWTSGNVYRLTSNVTVNSGVTLTIEGGTVVKFQTLGNIDTNRSLIVNGTLNLQSTPGNQIVFTSDRDDTYGGDSNGDGAATAPSNTDWGYIKINNDTTEFHDALVRYGGYRRDYGLSHQYQVWVDNADPIIRDSTFENGKSVALYYSAVASFDSNPQISNIVSDKQVSVFGSASANTTLQMSGNVLTASLYMEDLGAGTSVTGNTASIISLYDTSGAITVSDNTSSGIQLRENSSGVTVTGNTFTGQQPIYFYEDGSGNFNANTYTDPKRIGINGNVGTDATWGDIEGLGLPYHIYSNVTVNSGVTLTIEGGTVVKFQTLGNIDTNRSLIVNGTLNLQSTPGNQIVFTSDRDDTYGGDSNGDGAATAPSNTDWGYIKINNDTTEFHDALVRYGGYRRDYGLSHQYQVWVDNADPIIRDSTFENGKSVALYYSGSGTTGAAVTNTNFLNTSQYGVNNASPNTIDARNNWWGDFTGPGGFGPGTGASVSTNVLYDPWLLVPAVGSANGPTITSTPNTAAEASHPYYYDADSTATADGMGTITWSKLLGPPDFNIDPNGFISWTPSSPGDYVVSIAANDASGTNDQTWQISVSAPVPPQVTSFDYTLTSEGGGLSSAELVVAFSEGVQIQPIDVAVLDSGSAVVPLTSISYNVISDKLTIDVEHLIDGDTYTLLLLDTITDNALNSLDGEFDGFIFPSGNGAVGGNFVAGFAITTPSSSADFDSDGDVDGLDFLAWQRGFGTPAPTASKTDGDADNDLDVDGDDLAIWESQYGTTAPLAASVAAASKLPLSSLQEPQAAALSTEPLSVEAPIAAAAFREPVFVASSLEFQTPANNPQSLSAELIDAAIAIDLASRSRTEPLSANSAPLSKDQFDWISHSVRWSQKPAWQGSREIANRASHSQTFNIEYDRLNRNADHDAVNEELLDELFAEDEFGTLI